MIVGVVKPSDKKHLKNAEKVRFYKGLTHFQKDKDVKTSYEKLGKKTQKTYSYRILYKYTRPTFHYTHLFKRTLKTLETNACVKFR